MRTLQTVAALTCMKTLLMIFNVLFWFSGILLLILGVWLHVELNKFADFSVVEGSGGSTTAAAATTATTTTTTTTTAPYVLIGTGILILFLATLACCCTVNEQPVLIYIYAAFLTIVLIVETTACASGYAYRTQVSDAFRAGLNSSMQVYNVDYSRTSSINSIQAHVHCCGITRPTDWYETPYGKIPGSCCKTNMGCDTKDWRLVYSDGCYDLVTTMIKSNFGVVGSAAVGLAVFQLGGVVLAVLLGRLLIKTKYEQME